MTSTLTPLISTSYPLFAPNQVLSDRDLNRMVAYLDGQNRLTRTHFIGMGIASGLETSSDFAVLPAVEAKIHLSPGLGITSEGYAIALSRTTLTHFQAVQVPSQRFEVTPPVGSDETASNGTAAVYGMTELFTEAGQGRSPLHEQLGSSLGEAAFTEFLKDKILIVLYELEDRSRDTCLLDCDDLGRDRSFRLRYFLMPETLSDPDTNQLSAETLLSLGYPTDSLPAPWQGMPLSDIFSQRQAFSGRYYPRLQRFGYTDDGSAVQLSTIEDYSAFLNGYKTVCQQAIADIGESFPALFRLFSPFFSSFQPAADDFSGIAAQLTAQLRQIVPEGGEPVSLEQTEAQYAIQYFYDYLGQLIAAFHELADEAFDLMDDYAPDVGRFPKHLMLGPVTPPGATASIKDPSIYRSFYRQPPVYNGNQHRLQRVKFLYQRLLRLWKTDAAAAEEVLQQDSFFLLPFDDTPLKVTPSKARSAPLSEQAIPYYLNYAKLYQYWNYDRCRKGQNGCHPAYFYPQDAAERTCRLELIHRDDSPFYRVEGHVGEANSVALEQILEYQQQYNLAFDVVTLKLGSFDSLKDLNVSGQFESLDADFQRMKTAFQKLLDANEAWLKNVFIRTLKQVFFDQPSLAAISREQLVNPILSVVQSSSGGSDTYRFVAQGEDIYHLHIHNQDNTAIAVLAHRRLDGQIDGNLALDFSGLDDATKQAEQVRIANDLSNYFSVAPVSYGVLRQPAGGFRFRVSLSVSNTLGLPQSPATGEPRGSAPLCLLSTGDFLVTRPSDRPLIEQPEFQDFSTLYGLLRDVPQSNASGLDFGMGDPDAIANFEFFDFQGRLDQYRQQLERLMELHLFDRFAKHHPGMEHLGGVPKGGTFILVYVDGRDLVQDLLAVSRNSDYRARTAAIEPYVLLPTPSTAETITREQLSQREDIVVADFCLPYRCSSDALAVNYLVAPTRPIVLLEKAAFCAGDETRYEFILDPANGTLKGDGSFFDEGRYYFQPSRIQRSLQRTTALTFTYIVEGSYDTFVVTVHPLPDASFRLGPSPGRKRFCNNEAPIGVEATMLGQLQAFDGEADVSDTVLNFDAAPPQFLPAQVVLGDAREKSITLRHTVSSDEDCTSTAALEVTVHALPNANFTIGGGGTTFCDNDDPVALFPEQPGGSFMVRDAAEEPLAGAIEGSEGGFWRFLPAAVLTTGAGRVRVTLTYEIRDPDNDCTNTHTRSLTVHRAPTASFDTEISNVGPNGFTVRVNNIVLRPAEAVALQWTHEDGERIPGGEDDDTARFRLRYNHDIRTSEPGATKAITLQITAPPERGGCTSTITQEVEVPSSLVMALALVQLPESRRAEGDSDLPLAGEQRFPIRLEEEKEHRFERSAFDPSRDYRIEARTVPNDVDGVTFTYTPPSGSARQLTTSGAAPRRMPDWKPDVGTHVIEAKAFRMAGDRQVHSPTRTVTLIITESDDSGDVEIDEGDGGTGTDVVIPIDISPQGPDDDFPSFLGSQPSRSRLQTLLPWSGEAKGGDRGESLPGVQPLVSPIGLTGMLGITQGDRPVTTPRTRPIRLLLINAALLLMVLGGAALWSLQGREPNPLPKTSATSTEG